MSDIDMNKLAHLIVHQSCDDIKCHNNGTKKCPLFDTLCAKGFDFESVNIEEEITKAMEHYGIVKGDLLSYLVDK